MGAVCIKCKHFAQGVLSAPSLCLHPSAATVDRVRGTLHPRLSSIGFPNDREKIQETTDKCDAEGWYEEAGKWWWPF